MKARLTRAAQLDIRDAGLFIAEDSPEAARRWRTNLLSRIKLLAEAPRIGRARDDLRPGLRTFVQGSYLIIYRITPEGIEVVRVLHGARQWPDLL